MRSSELADPSEAQFKEERRELGHQREGILSTPRLCLDWHGTARLPLTIYPTT